LKTDRKVDFAEIEGDIATGPRKVSGWPSIVHLRADPYEKMAREGKIGYLRWYADLLWLFVPVQGKIKEFLGTIPDSPFQQGSSLNAAGINYNTLRAQEVLRRLQQMENLSPPRRTEGRSPVSPRAGGLGSGGRLRGATAARPACAEKGVSCQRWLGGQIRDGERACLAPTTKVLSPAHRGSGHTRRW
jgi:hypothetical protein